MQWNKKPNISNSDRIIAFVLSKTFVHKLTDKWMQIHLQPVPSFENGNKKTKPTHKGVN